MGFLDSIKEMFSEGTKSLDEDLSRREAELNATPEQRMEMLQDEMEDNDSAFEDLQSKIDHKGAVALANTELNEQEQQAHESEPENSATTDQASTDGDANTPASSTNDGIADAVLVDTDDVDDERNTK